MSQNRELLRICLQAAVPLRIAEIASWPAQRRIETARAQATVIASHGDDLLYGGKHCADTFNAMALGLACMAYAPGGVTFLDDHYIA